MPNIRFGFRNIFDVDQGCTLTASPALVATMNEANLQRQERFRMARSTSLATQDIKASWLVPKRFNYLFTKMHNYTVAAQERIRTYTDSAWTTGQIDNAAANCFAYTGHDVNDVVTEADYRLLKNSVRYVTLVAAMQSLIQSLTDPANPDGVFEISRLHGGEYWEMAYNPPYGGATLTFEDFSTQDMAHDGSLISAKGPKRRRLEINASFCAEADWKKLLAMCRMAGKDRDIFVSLYPGDGTYLEAYHHGLWKLQEITAFDRHVYGLAQQRLIFIEA